MLTSKLEIETEGVLVQKGKAVRDRVRLTYHKSENPLYSISGQIDFGADSQAKDGGVIRVGPYRLTLANGEYYSVAIKRVVFDCDDGYLSSVVADFDAVEINLHLNVNLN